MTHAAGVIILLLIKKLVVFYSTSEGIIETSSALFSDSIAD